jgi:LacI family transcriptional regulator
MRIAFLGVGFEDHAPPALAERLRAAPLRALFCLDHETTLAVYMLLRQLGLRPGADLAFASFDEKEWMRLVAPGITAVRQPVEEMADCAWTMLGRRIAGETGPPRMRRLRCAVTFRGSTALRTSAERTRLP